MFLSYVHHFVNLCEFKLELWSGKPKLPTLTFWMDITFVNGNNSWEFHDDTMRGALWKCVTADQTDGQKCSKRYLIAPKKVSVLTSTHATLGHKRSMSTPIHRLNTLILRQNGQQYAHGIYKIISFNGNFYISFKFYWRLVLSVQLEIRNHLDNS